MTSTSDDKRHAAQILRRETSALGDISLAWSLADVAATLDREAASLDAWGASSS